LLPQVDVNRHGRTMQRHRNSKPLWKPGSEREDAAAAHPAAEEEAADDELDALLDHYSSQAEQQAAAARKRDGAQRGSGTLAQREASARESGLQQGLSAANK
jgi:hypothetical protein